MFSCVVIVRAFEFIKCITWQRLILMTRHVFQDFRIFSSDESQMFLAANHQQGHTNLYVSDVTGQFFTTSLYNVTYIQYYTGFMPDVYEVGSCQVIFLGNYSAVDSIDCRCAAFKVCTLQIASRQMAKQKPS